MAASSACLSYLERTLARSWDPESNSLRQSPPIFVSIRVLAVVKTLVTAFTALKALFGEETLVAASKRVLANLMMLFGVDLLAEEGAEAVAGY